MEGELDHIGGGEAERGQGREKELIDDSRTRHVNRTGSGPGGMRGNNHARAVSLRGHRQLSTLKEVPADPTCGMHELLISRQGETLFDLCELQEPVIFATHRLTDPSPPQIRDNGSVAIQAIQSNEGLSRQEAL